MERAELQSRRAYNQIWNAAERYDLPPEEAAFDAAGEPRLYLNTVMGLARSCYDFSKFLPLLHSFAHQDRGDLYTDVFWLGLEHAVYGRCAARRPVLAELRRSWARQLLSEPAAGDPRESAGALWQARARQVLGTASAEPASLQELMDALAFAPDWDEQTILRQTEALLYRFYRRPARDVKDRQWAAWVGRRPGKNGAVRLVRPNALRAFGRGGGPAGAAGDTGPLRLLHFLQGRTPEPILRRYVEDCFGASLLPPGELAEAERTLCTGVHRGCRLHFTAGAPTGRAPSPAAAWDVENFRRQGERNRAYYRAHLAQNRLAIAQLVQKLQNTLLLQQEADACPGRSGTLLGAVAWRAAVLDDERIFSRREPRQPGDLTVDILLDGSASQNTQQEKLAAQAYILAEALTRCGIAVRVTAFCSVSGCTVLRVLRDYEKPKDNEKIFNYAAAGWTRDGLALRAMGRLMEKTAGERRLLVILSDASPNDDQRIPIGALPLGGYVYSGRRGVEDTAAQVKDLRRQGIRPVCIFTGSDRELPDARRIYGSAVERIPTVGWFADAVGRLLCRQIQKL